ncbi:Hypothetical predicted protein, partial [Pelobates cultripes]
GDLLQADVETEELTRHRWGIVCLRTTKQTNGVQNVNVKFDCKRSLDSQRVSKSS